MSEDEEFPATVETWDGGLVQIRAGTHNGEVVTCEVEGTTCSWPIVWKVGRAHYEVTGFRRKKIRWFYVDMEIGSFALPAELLPEVFREKLNELKEASRRPDGTLDEHVLAQKAVELGIAETKAVIWAKVIKRDPTPRTVGQVFKGAGLSAMTRRLKEGWAMLVGAFGFGFIQAFNVAGNAGTPDFVRSGWFAILLPLAMFGLIVYGAVKK